ncbi:10676_t:CDS:2 [Dentiscutata erythropus]|uniref:10676_t:CDS:1 n=1 Tax=Dentiscutata erythropus TaxID=1348616 RepID=A0A9N9HZP4_9GLOM|nr:10676_t:CDS:2 [Dentiscutata erythropus]
MLLPNWLVFSTRSIPFRTSVYYGLFKKCTGYNDTCRPFPSVDQHDCNERNFCEEWEAAAIGMILAAVVGGLAWLHLVSVLVGGRAMREKAWKILSVLFFVYGIRKFAILQFSSIAFIAHLYSTADTFYYGTKYDVSFVLANVSASLSIVLGITLFMNGLLSPPEYMHI